VDGPVFEEGWKDVLLRCRDPWKVKKVTILDERVVSDHKPVLVVFEWQGS
jgi:hypothetical protein